MKTHILCLGDSNTHGYCADPKTTPTAASASTRTSAGTCRLQTALGSQYLVTEEGLSGRTTVFVDPHPRIHGRSERRVCPAEEP